MHSSLYSNYISVKLKKKSKEDDKYSTAERTGQSLLSICIHYKKKKRERERAYLLSLIVPDKIKHIVLLLPLCFINDSKYFLCR